jgi:hypothetical protein
MKKKLGIPLLTVTFILCISLAAYAVTWTGTSSIQTSTLLVTGSSTTNTSETWSIVVANSLYQDGQFRNSSQNTGYGTSVTTSCSSLNLPGSQFWECYGEHPLMPDGGIEIVKTSYASKYW